MGVSGLLKTLKSITNTNFHISSLKGFRVAIDAYVWLHKGSYHCSEALALGQPTTFFVDYILNWISFLQNHGIREIIVVFDGQSLQMKEDTSSDRRDMREGNFNRAMEAKACGDHDKAEMYFQRSVTVTFDMVLLVISALKQHDIHYLIAPYEADAQLAFLSMNNLVDAVITEDSDVLIYGCRRVIYKLDRSSGLGHEIYRKDLGRNEDMSFQGWSDEQFVTFCCLVGCDYCANLHGMGIKTAYKYVNHHRNFNDIIKALKTTWKISSDVTYDYIVKLWRAYLTFRHQVIYDPLHHKMKHLRDISDDMMRRHVAMMKKCYPMIIDDAAHDMKFLGMMLSDDVAQRFAQGFISPQHIVDGQVIIQYHTSVNEDDGGKVQVETSWMSSSSAHMMPSSSSSLLSKAVVEDVIEETNIWAFESSSASLAVSSSTANITGDVNNITIGSSSSSSSSNTHLKISEDYHSDLLSSSFESIQRKKRRMKDQLPPSSSSSSPVVDMIQSNDIFFDRPPVASSSSSNDDVHHPTISHDEVPIDLPYSIRATISSSQQGRLWPIEIPESSSSSSSDSIQVRVSLSSSMIPSSSSSPLYDTKLSSPDPNMMMNDDVSSGLWPPVSSISNAVISRSAIDELKNGILDDMDRLPINTSSSASSSSSSSGFHIIYDLPSHHDPLPSSSFIPSSYHSKISSKPSYSSAIPCRQPLYTSSLSLNPPILSASKIISSHARLPFDPPLK